METVNLFVHTECAIQVGVSAATDLAFLLTQQGFHVTFCLVFYFQVYQIEASVNCERTSPLSHEPVFRLFPTKLLNCIK